MNKQQLASKIWQSANKMRSKIEANEYKDYILGFMFYKFLSEQEEKMLKYEGWADEDFLELTEDDADTVQYIKTRLGYFISYDNLFSTWISAGNKFSSDNVITALGAFNRNINKAHKKVFVGIFNTLEHGLSKLGQTASAITKAVRDLIHLINDIPMDSRQDYDVLGFIYEYLISNFAANAGKKAGEFYTPHEVSLLMSELVAYHLKDREKIVIYDPTSGSGSLLINIGRSAARYMKSPDHIMYYAQELKENTYNLTRMNLIMRGIRPDNLFTRNADTLEDDWPYFDEEDPVNTYKPLYVDAVVSNPPYSQHWDPSGHDSDPRYARYGVAPKAKADYAFLLHDLYHLKPDGIMTIVLPHGVLFRGGEEEKIRRNLIEFNNIDAIISLPPNIFFGTGIPTIIMVLKQKRDETDVLFIDASKGFEKEGKSNALRARDIKKITDTYVHRADIEKYSRKVSRDEIRTNEYNLNIPRYLDSSEEAESFDLYATIFGGIPESELVSFSAYWQLFPSLKTKLFTPVNESYWQTNTENLEEVIKADSDVQEYLACYQQAFSDFGNFLNKNLIEQMQQIDPEQGESIISDNMFARLASFSLIDRYVAYQCLDDIWQNVISPDLEVIQSESFGAVRIVEPNMVLKSGSDTEEQQKGWKGQLLPFDLVEKVYFADDKQAVEELTSKVESFLPLYEELIEQLSEDAKESEFFDNEKGKFISKEVKKAIKEKLVDENTLNILKDYEKHSKNEKTLKSLLKEKLLQLELKVKKFIENISDEDAIELLKLKWNEPLVKNINILAQNQISEFAVNLEKTAEKYKDNYSLIDHQIAEEEKALSSMLDELTGSELDMKAIAEFKKLLGAY